MQNHIVSSYYPSSEQLSLNYFSLLTTNPIAPSKRAITAAPETQIQLSLVFSESAVCYPHPAGGFYEGCKVFHPATSLLGNCVDKPAADLSQYGMGNWAGRLKQDFKEKRGANSKCFQFRNATNYWGGQRRLFPVCYEFQCTPDGHAYV